MFNQKFKLTAIAYGRVINSTEDDWYINQCVVFHHHHRDNHMVLTLINSV